VGGWDRVFVFDPVELLERLASLTPRPRINLLLYCGIWGRGRRGVPASPPSNQASGVAPSSSL
jgi:hypothetical protein